MSLLGALHFLAAPIIIDHVLAPRANPENKGWRVLFFGKEGAAGKPLFERVVEGQDRLEMKNKAVSLSAFALWRVDRPGRYVLTLVSDGTSVVYIDGRRVLTPDSAPPMIHHGRQVDPGEFMGGGSQGTAEVELSAGRHLVQIDMHSPPRKKAHGTLKVAGPGSAEAASLSNEVLRHPALDSLAAWAGLLRLSGNSMTVTLAALALTALLVLLPMYLAGGWQAFFATCLVVALPAVTLPSPPRKLSFTGGSTILYLQAQQPDYVIIGNSLADNGLDDNILGRLAGGKVRKLIFPGSRTTVDYLMFKNVLVASGVRPKTTFIFTRDNFLTNPHLLVFQRAFERLSPSHEPLIDELVYGANPLRQAVYSWAREIFQVGAYQPKMKLVVPELALGATALTAKAAQKGQLGQVVDRVNQRFGLEHIKGQMGDVEPQGNADWYNADYDENLYLDFDKVVDRSFLPHFISLAKENNMRLVFVRVQRRPTESGPPPQDPRLVRYVERLREYLTSRGVGFYDFTGEPSLTLPVYGASDHVADEQADLYSRLFYDRLAWAFK